MDDRYQNQPWYIRAFRWWRYMPPAYLRVVWKILLWSWRDSILWDEYDNTWWKRASLIYDLEMGGADCHMRHVYSMDEVRERLLSD